jgi:hypothetical protein
MRNGSLRLGPAEAASSGKGDPMNKYIVMSTDPPMFDGIMDAVNAAKKHAEETGKPAHIFEYIDTYRKEEGHGQT